MWMGLHSVQIEGRDLLTLPARAFMTRLKINWRFGPYQTAPRARLAKVTLVGIRFIKVQKILLVMLSLIFIHFHIGFIAGRIMKILVSYVDIRGLNSKDKKKLPF